MNRVVDVRPLQNYRIWLRFSDGAQGEVDLSDLAGRGVFAVWADRELFKAVRPEVGGGIEWPGEIDLCPDALYLRLSGKTAQDIFPSLGGSLPSDLLLAKPAGDPFHALFAADVEGDNIRVVTAYHPSLDEWEPDLRTRRVKP